MKILSIEDKAKRYEEVLAMAKEYVTYIPGDVANYIFNMFPELKESTDEGIRESIIGFLKTISSLKDGQTVSNEDFDTKVILEWVAWLKKQGKQSNEEPQVYETRDGEVITYSESKGYKVAEPKFKFGDWIILTAGELSVTLQIINVDINRERYWFNDGSYLPFADEECLHLWTIEDAKDGDILACNNGWACIFKCLNDNLFSSHCFMDSEGWFCETGGQAHVLDNSINCHPATKEQRELLLTKLKESGHEWDADKKELKKIEQKSVEETSCDRCKKAQPSHSCQDITELGRCYLEHEKQGEQKLIWDKFDDLMLKDMIEFIESGWSGNGKSHLIYWLKSIKDRIK